MHTCVNEWARWDVSLCRCKSYSMSQVLQDESLRRGVLIESRNKEIEKKYENENIKVCWKVERVGGLRAGSTICSSWTLRCSVNKSMLSLVPNKP